MKCSAKDIKEDHHMFQTLLLDNTIAMDTCLHRNTHTGYLGRNVLNQCAKESLTPFPLREEDALHLHPRHVHFALSASGEANVLS